MTDDRPRPRIQSLARWATAAYCIALVTATHWPGVEIHGPIERPDLVIHALVFAVLGAMAVLTGWFGKPESWRAILLGWIAVGIFGGLDEWTQHLPPFNRHTALDDWLADTAGAFAGSATAGIWTRRRLARETA